MKFATFLASHAATMGAKDAVVCGDRRLSFAELDGCTTRLAHALRAAGVQVGDRVAVHLPNGIDFVLAFIAAIKAGAIAVPINPPLSPAEVAHIVGDCSPRAIFFDARTEATLEQAWRHAPGALRIAADARGGADLCLPDLVSAGSRAPVEVPHDHDACMIGYTSGTTGRAKGVVLTQSNYLYVNGYLNGYHWGLGAADRHLCTTPLAHRTGMARLMNMILHGATMVAMPKFDAAQAAELVERERITVFGMVPTVGRMMLPEIEAAPQRFATLRVMLVTGEAFPYDVKRRLQDALPHAKLYSFYAMTEAGAIAGLNAGEQFTHPDSVGRPWPGIELKLVDTDGNEAPAGEVGEIWVRSGRPGVYSTMREYFGRPEATAETLRDGWVVTGDMGRLDAQGYLYLVDRKKDMVLSGGYNIYSKEVELAIASFPGVADVAVVGVPDAVYGEAVAAYVQLAGGTTPDAAAIVAHCRGLIASYKKPRHVFFVDELPRTSTGKVQKSRLREQFCQVSRHSGAAP